jgi:hypothetical protein
MNQRDDMDYSELRQAVQKLAGQWFRMSMGETVYAHDRSKATFRRCSDELLDVLQEYDKTQAEK